MRKEKPSGNNMLMQYLGLGFQLAVWLGVVIYAGIWLDKKVALKFPLFVWLLPLLLLAGMLIKIIKDTTKK
jgi:hypothetical protein